MAHYAFIDESNTVVEVIVGKDENELIDGIDPETHYGNFRGLNCKRTSYNANIRGAYAGVGFTYNEEEDIFIAPQPFPSWNRVGSFWQAPVAYPQDGKRYSWNEETGSWNELS